MERIHHLLSKTVELGLAFARGRLAPINGVPLENFLVYINKDSGQAGMTM